MAGIVLTSLPVRHCAVPPLQWLALVLAPVSNSVGPIALQGNTNTADEVDVSTVELALAAVTHGAVKQILKHRASVMVTELALRDN